MIQFGDLLQIDLNCDMGEGMDTDAAIMPFISSANIACGYHAGDEDTMRRTVELALLHGVAIGAHPSYPDREHFGRIDLLGQSLPGSANRDANGFVPEGPSAILSEGLSAILPEDLPAIITDQLATLQKICEEFGASIHHVKPHGALYNRAAKDFAVSDLICGAVRQFDPALQLYGLSGSEMKESAGRHGLAFVSEVFADRTYRADGSLTPRTEKGALIESPEAAAGQVLRMIKSGTVAAVSGQEIAIRADTVCIHGDGSHAVSFAKAIHSLLIATAVSIRTPGKG